MLRAAALTLLLLGATTAAAQDAEKARAPRWVVPEAGLSAPIPKGWAIVPGNGGREILRNVAPGVVFGENINLNVRELREHPGMANVVEMTRTQLQKAGMTVASAAEAKTADGVPIGVFEFVRSMKGMPGGKARFRQVVWYLGQAPRVVQVVCTLTCVESTWSTSKQVFDAFQADLRLHPLGKLSPPKHPAAPPVKLPTYGFGVTPPPGWLPLEITDADTAIQWIKRAPALPRRKRGTILSIEVRPIPAAKVEAYARDVAKRLGAKVEPGPKVGGVAGWSLVRAEPWFESVFCARSGLVYSISIEGSHDRKADEPVFDAVVESFAWQTLEAPAAHLALGNKRRPVLNTFLIKLPDVARPRKQQSRDAQQFVVTDYTRRDVEVLVSNELARIPNVAAQRLSTFRDRFGALVTRRLGYDEPLEWEPSATPFTGYRSKPLRFTKGEVSLSIAYAVFFADRDTAVAITVTTSTPKSPQLKARYDALAREILDSVRMPRAVLAAQRKR